MSLIKETEEYLISWDHYTYDTLVLDWCNNNICNLFVRYSEMWQKLNIVEDGFLYNTIRDYIDLSIVEEIIALNNTNAKPQIQVVDDGMTIVVEGWEVYIDEDGTILTDIKLLKRLQLLRRKIGDGRNVAYYLIASNKLLVRLATKKPTTREEFLAIKGIRDRWFDNNGQAFMEEIREYVESK